MYKLHMIAVSLISKESRDKKWFQALTSHSPFLDAELNNTQVRVSSGESLTLNCRVDRHQMSVVSWSVTREDSSLDLLTVGNLTFSGDQRFSILHQPHNDWVLVINTVSMGDSGTYICTIQTFPQQNILVKVRVLAPTLRLSTSSTSEEEEKSVFTAGSSISLTCTHLNSSLLDQESSTTLLPWQPGPALRVKLPSTVIQWTCNNKTFSTLNRKRVSAHQRGAETVSVLSIASSLETDSGNYSCSVPGTDLRATVEVVIQQARTRQGELISHLRPSTTTSHGFCLSALRMTVIIVMGCALLC